MTCRGKQIAIKLLGKPETRTLFFYSPLTIAIGKGWKMARTSSVLAFLILGCLLPAALAIKFYKYGACAHSNPCSNIPTNGLTADWALIVSTAPAKDNTFSYWGPTFYGCDTNSLLESCCNQGIYYASGDDNTNSSGFAYGYNKKLEKWTIEQFSTIKRTIPGSTLVVYETFYNVYITVESGLIFKDGSYSAVSGKEINVNPMLRRSRWVLLETDENKSYRIIMNCENVDGFLYDGYPQIQVYVKRSEIDNYKSIDDIRKLTYYEAITKALVKQQLNPDLISWRYIPQDLPSPTDTVFNSINWDKCSCKISGVAFLAENDTSPYY